MQCNQKSILILLQAPSTCFSFGCFFSFISSGKWRDAVSSTGRPQCFIIQERNMNKSCDRNTPAWSPRLVSSAPAVVGFNHDTHAVSVSAEKKRNHSSSTEQTSSRKNNLIAYHPSEVESRFPWLWQSIISSLPSKQCRHSFYFYLRGEPSASIHWSNGKPQAVSLIIFQKK